VAIDGVVARRSRGNPVTKSTRLLRRYAARNDSFRTLQGVNQNSPSDKWESSENDLLESRVGADLGWPDCRPRFLAKIPIALYKLFLIYNF